MATILEKRTKYHILKDTKKHEVDLLAFGETLIGTAKPIIVIGVNAVGVNAFVDIVDNMPNKEPFLCYMVCSNVI